MNELLEAMGPDLQPLLLQFGAVTVAAMALSERIPIKIGTVSEEPNQGSRKRWSALIYSTAMNGLGVGSGLMTMPGETWWRQGIGVLFVSSLTVAASGIAVAITKSVRGENP